MDDPTGTPPAAARLRREVGLAGAVLMGLGSIVGTGVFVSLGIAAGVAGPAVVLAVALAAGALTAMLGVLLNLILGLSRVLLAMGRRGDMPRVLARIDAAGTTPAPAVLLTGIVVAALAAAGSVRATWSFSAFTVLVYYALTNLAALRLPAEHRRYPRWVAAAGLLACLFLAFWVEPAIWAAGLGLLAAGLVWHLVARRRRRSLDPGPWTPGPARREGGSARRYAARQRRSGTCSAM